MITIIENENKKHDLSLRYGAGETLLLRKGGSLKITNDGWLCVVNNVNNHVHY